MSRRAQEAALYLTPVNGQADNPMPQTVDPESSFIASPINKGGIIAGGTAAVATASEVVNTVGAFKTGVDGLGTWLVPILLVVALCAIGWMVYERIQLRKKGIL